MRYFFNTVDGGFSEDDEGLELPDSRSARASAIRYAGEVMSNNPDVLWDGSEFKVEVADEHGSRLFTVVCHTIDEPTSERA